MIWWILPACAALSWWLTGSVRQFALRRQLMDIPNARSSHAVPTPRGGGVAVVFAFMAGWIACWILGGVSTHFSIAVLPAGVVVALVGFADDRGQVAPRWRLLAHFLSAGWVVWWAGIPAMFAPLEHLDSTHVSAVLLSMISMAWMLNLTNFMDGIDGLAAIEVLSFSAGGLALMRWIGAPLAVCVPLGVLGAAVAGFLPWNWSRARIFMGDSGSGFLGLMLGVFALYSGGDRPAMAWSLTILLGAFAVDSTWTLLRRLIRGARVSEAHRDHAYQHAARRWGSHATVSLAVGLINVCWLLPVAALVAADIMPGMVGLCLAYSPLAATAWWLGAGVPESAAHP